MDNNELLEATQESLREHMFILREIKNKCLDYKKEFGTFEFYNMSAYKQILDIIEKWEVE